MDYASRVSMQIAQIKPTQSKTAVLVSRSAAGVEINTGESTVTVPFVGISLPPVGHPVQVEVSDGQIRVTGAARALPPTGIVTVAANGTVATIVDDDGIAYTLPYQTASPPVLGDEMQITWTIKGGIIQGKVTPLPTPNTPFTPPAGSGGAFHPAPFTAIGSGSFGSRWFTNDVYSSASNQGAFFFGSKVADTIPDSAAITLARIFLNPRSTSGAAPILQVHTSPTQPGGAVAFVGSGYALPARSGWVDIPLSMIDLMKTGAYGLGFNHGGYSIFKGVGADNLSGALDIAWVA